MAAAMASDPNPAGQGPTLPGAGPDPAKEAPFPDDNDSRSSRATASTADAALDWDWDLGDSPRPRRDPDGPRCDLALPGRRMPGVRRRASSSWTAGSAESDALLAALLRGDDPAGPARHASSAPPAAPGAGEFRWRASRIKDSVAVRWNRAPNDDEVHEEGDARVEDWLVPRRDGRVDEADAATERPASADGCLRDEKSEGQAAVAGEEDTPRTADAEGETEDPEAGKPKGKGVRFGNILIRDYPMVMGDNPCCGYGPPVTLDWCYLEYTPLSVDEYERHRPPRRTIRQMGRNYYNRKALLEEAGYTEEDFRECKKEMKRIKSWRTINRTVANNVVLLKASDAAESLGRKLRRATGKADHWKSEKGLYDGRGDGARGHIGPRPLVVKTV